MIYITQHVYDDMCMLTFEVSYVDKHTNTFTCVHIEYISMPRRIKDDVLTAVREYIDSLNEKISYNIVALI